jgi:hypothetical protein
LYPHERSLVKQMEGRPFVLIGVNSDSTLEKARNAVKEEKLTWRSFQNKPEGAESSISEAWGVTGWPTVVVLDETMKIRHRSSEGLDAAALAKRLVRELEAKSKPAPEPDKDDRRVP